MSHYRIAVVTTPESPGVEELLAPYSEYLDVEPYIEFTHAEAIEQAHKEIENAQKHPNEKRVAHIINSTKDLDDEQLFKWFLNYYYGKDHPVDEDGNILTTYNPNSKYDYYSEMDELTVDEWYKYSFYDDDENREPIDYYKEWEERSTKGDGWYNKNYYLDKFGDADTYVRWCHLPCGYAIVTPDGEWHAPGTVGWFATDDMTPQSIRKHLDWFDTFKENLDPNSTITILDCHI